MSDHGYQQKRCMNHELYTHRPHVWGTDDGRWYCPGSGVEADQDEQVLRSHQRWTRGRRP